MITTKETSEHKSPEQRRSQAGDVAAPHAANKLSRRITAGPVMAAQRKSLDKFASAMEPIQKQSAIEEEELLQGKFAVQFQPEEEEDLMQGTFDSRGPHAATKDDGQP